MCLKISQKRNLKRDFNVIRIRWRSSFLKLIVIYKISCSIVVGGWYCRFVKDKIIGRNAHRNWKRNGSMYSISKSRNSAANKQYLSPETSGKCNKTPTFTFHLAITIHSVSMSYRMLIKEILDAIRTWYVYVSRFLLSRGFQSSYWAISNISLCRIGCSLKIKIKFQRKSIKHM